MTRIRATPVDHYFVYHDTALVRAGTPLDVGVLALDADDQILTDYQDEIAFASTDPLAITPGPYRFRLSDEGIALFPGGVTLFTPGRQVVFVFDTATQTIFGSVVLYVQ